MGDESPPTCLGGGGDDDGPDRARSGRPLMPGLPSDWVDMRAAELPGGVPRVKPPVWDTTAERLQRQYEVILKELQQLYESTVLPLEDIFRLESFRPSRFGDMLLNAKPFVLLLGPFSSGKTTFVNYLLGKDWMYTGPEPTTNKFTVVLHGNEFSHISGRVLASSATQPFRGLAGFGSEFLECFSGVQIPHDLLRRITFIDTPGVLEAVDSMHSRTYDYPTVCRWFVERSDLIFVLFDPTKLDAGNEIRGVFQTALRGHESKVRIVLNKADQVAEQELMRVYGSLFWNLSNLVRTTEPPRVFVSSFIERPYQPDTNHRLFEREKRDLLVELFEATPRSALDKRVAMLLRRAQDTLMHSCIVGTCRAKLPMFFGRKKTKGFLRGARKVSINGGGLPDGEGDEVFLHWTPAGRFPQVSDTDSHG